jgi:nicotinamidase/pyrazinamidase
MKVIRIDVDTQRGFCSEDGNLYVPADPAVLANIRGLVSDAAERGIPLVGSVDSHAYDAWEFQDNGGPFPAHCVKGTADWLKVSGTLPARFRFVPMSTGHLAIGEDKAGAGNRAYGAETFSAEARDGVGLYFEKEVYSAFANPNAEAFIDRLVNDLGGPESVVFQVFGYCTGGFCVDAFATGLLERGYRVQVVLDATAAIDTPDNGMDGVQHSAAALAAAGVEIVTTQQALEAA